MRMMMTMMMTMSPVENVRGELSGQGQYCKGNCEEEMSRSQCRPQCRITRFYMQRLWFVPLCLTHTDSSWSAIPI